MYVMFTLIFYPNRLLSPPSTPERRYLIKSISPIHSHSPKQEHVHAHTYIEHTSGPATFPNQTNKEKAPNSVHLVSFLIYVQPITKSATRLTHSLVHCPPIKDEIKDSRSRWDKRSSLFVVLRDIYLWLDPGPRTRWVLSLPSLSLSPSIAIGRLVVPLPLNLILAGQVSSNHFIFHTTPNFSFRIVHRSTSAPSSSTVFTYILSHSTTRSSLITHYFLILSSYSFLLLPSVHPSIHPPTLSHFHHPLIQIK